MDNELGITESSSLTHPVTECLCNRGSPLQGMKGWKAIPQKEKLGRGHPDPSSSDFLFSLTWWPPLRLHPSVFPLLFSTTEMWNATLSPNFYRYHTWLCWPWGSRCSTTSKLNPWWKTSSTEEWNYPYLQIYLHLLIYLMFFDKLHFKIVFSKYQNCKWLATICNITIIFW